MTEGGDGRRGQKGPRIRTGQKGAKLRTGEEASPAPAARSARDTDAADEICEPCRPDAVIIVCYPDQRISVPYAALEEAAGEKPVGLLADIVAAVLTNHGMRVDNIRTNNIATSSLQVYGLGHAGVCILDGEAELAYYYEYGRYDQPRQYGEVRVSADFGASQSLPFSDKDPTLAGLQDVGDKLRTTNSQGGVNFRSVYVKTSEGTASTMKATAESQMPDKRPQYDLDGNHCMTFALDIAQSGRVDVSSARNGMGFNFTDADRTAIAEAVDQYDYGIEGRIGSIFGITQRRKAEGTQVAIDQASEMMGTLQVPALQIAALQRIYKTFNHRPFEFEGFPAHPYERK